QRLGPQSVQRQLALGRKVVAQPAEAYTGGAGSDTHRQATHPHGKQVRRNGTIDLLLPRQAILRWAAPAAAYLIGHTASSCATYPREASHSCARPHESPTLFIGYIGILVYASGRPPAEWPRRAFVGHGARR